jgi:hypothetical protein
MPSAEGRNEYSIHASSEGMPSADSAQHDGFCTFWTTSDNKEFLFELSMLIHFFIIYIFHFKRDAVKIIYQHGNSYDSFHSR